MKRTIIAAFLFIGIFSANAQEVTTPPTLNYNALEKKLKKRNYIRTGLLLNLSAWEWLKLKPNCT